MTRKADVGGARLGNAPMPATDVLRRYIGQVITDVNEQPNGDVVLSLHLQGRTYNPPTRLVIKGVTGVRRMADPKPRREEWTQSQIDIGDEMYETERYSEHDIDVEPDRTATRGTEPI